MISMFTFSSNKHACHLFTIQSATLSALSLGDDVARTPKYFLAILGRVGYILVNIKKLLISKRRIGILKKLPKQGEDSESL